MNENNQFIRFDWAMRTPEEVFPEYYIIRVNEFNQVATTPLEEWIAYLKNGEIREDTTTPGLAEAREKLQTKKMTLEEWKEYERDMDAIMTQNDVLNTAKMEGLAEGRAEGKRETAINLKAMGLSVDQIAKATGLSTEDIDKFKVKTRMAVRNKNLTAILVIYPVPRKVNVGS